MNQNLAIILGQFNYGKNSFIVLIRHVDVDDEIKFRRNCLINYSLCLGGFELDF